MHMLAVKGVFRRGSNGDDESEVTVDHGKSHVGQRIAIPMSCCVDACDLPSDASS